MYMYSGACTDVSLYEMTLWKNHRRKQTRTGPVMHGQKWGREGVRPALPQRCTHTSLLGKHLAASVEMGQSFSMSTAMPFLLMSVRCGVW